MASRYISTSFWDDTWIQEELTTEEMLVYIYLLTNPLTNIAGIYEIGIRRICFDTKLDQKTITSAIENFEKAGKVRFYNNWMILINWTKHQSLKAESNVRKGIDRVLEEVPKDVFSEVVQCDYQYEFIKELARYKEIKQAPYKPLVSPSQEPPITLPYYTSLNSTIPNGIYSPASQDGVLHNDNSKSESGIPYDDIVDYLNQVVGTRYQAKSKNTRAKIKARWNEGYRLDDFKRVIDVKTKDWLDTDSVKYLRPETLFGPKFESYLNQPMPMTNQERNLAILQSYVEKMDCELPGGEDDENRSDQSDGIPF